jgi:glycosyltransferase involved in cell wall biosynthesis
VQNAPLFSIVINNYNYGRFIEEAIDSAMAQTYQPTEVVVVDDGSTDDSRDRIDRYGDRVVKVFQENAGQTAAMNAGFAASRGEFVLFLDSDDVLSSDVVERAVAVFDRYPQTVLVHWRMRVVDAAGKLMNETMPKLDPEEGQYLRSMVLTYGPNSFRRVPTSGNALRRSFVERVAPFPMNERELGLSSAGVDAYLSMLAPLFGLVRRLPEPSGRYRVHGNNSYAGSDFDAKMDRLLKLYESHCESLHKTCESLGVSCDTSLWRSRSWPHLLDRSLSEMREAIDLSKPFVLIDEAQWGMDCNDKHRAIPFLERDGVYWGRPANDRVAIEELTRLQAEGVQHVVVAWPAFWWLDHYAGFAQHLRQHARRLIDNERIIVFRLSASTGID